MKKFYHLSLLSLILFSSVWTANAQLAIEGPFQVCPQTEAVYSIEANITACDSAYLWEINPNFGTIIGANDGTSVTVAWGDEGVGILNLTVFDSCAFDALVFAVEVLVGPFLTQQTLSICSGGCVQFSGQQLCDPGNYTFNLTSFMGCDSIIEVEVVVQPGLVTDLGVICGGSTTVCGQLFDSPGVYEITCVGSTGCDSTVTFTLVDADAVQADAGVDALLSCDNPVGVLDGTGSSVGPFNYLWEGPNSFLSTDISVTITDPGQYCLTVADPLSGCSDTDCAEALIDADGIVVDIAPASIPCDGSSLTLDATASDTGPQFVYQWLTNNGNIISGEQTLTPVVEGAGTYCLNIFDTSNGCSADACIIVDSELFFTVESPFATCVPGAQEFTINVDGNSPPFTAYVAAEGEEPMVFGGLMGATLVVVVDVQNTTTFKLWANDSGGCVSDTLFRTIGLYNAEIEFNLDQQGCNPAVLGAVFITDNPANPPALDYVWSNGETAPSILVSESGTYSVTIVDVTGCAATNSIFVSVDYAGTCSYINGNVFNDLEEDCQLSGPDTPLEDWLVVAVGTANQVFFNTTDADGNYSIPVDPGDYTVSLVLPNEYWEACTNDIPVSLPNVDDVATLDFLVKKLPGCPQLTVDISTSLLRRCFTNNFYFVHYCNEGVQPAEDAYVTIELDPFLELVFSAVPHQNLGDNIYRFDLGQVEVGECGDFSLQVEVRCDAALGQMHCTEAHIYPDTTCLPPDPQWLGASLNVEVECLDSIYFTITNIGDAAMTEPLEYLVIEDAVMYMIVPDGPVLGAGESIELAFPANGSTWRVELAQEAFHPLAAAPVSVLEGCGVNGSGGISTGFVNQFAFGDEVGFVDVDCFANTGSFDPNDKQAFPVGYGDEHYIEPGTQLEYLIRFQNTGTDTAFTVVVRDTLSQVLDVTTVRPGASSHLYEFETYGEGILKFTFPDIMLPDSNVNVEGSQGFVKFRVSPKANVPLGTLLENRAAIYFDFNEPVVTNTVSHIIDKDFIMVTSIHTAVENVEMKAYPNPFDESVKFEIDGYRDGKLLTFRLIDQMGRTVEQMGFQAPGFDFTNTKLPGGLYFFEIEDNGMLVAAGKLLRK